MPISVEKKKRTIYLTLERPPLNVLNLSLLGELRALLKPLRKDSKIDFLVLRGAVSAPFQPAWMWGIIPKRRSLKCLKRCTA